jgi:hypothetical protein
MQENAFEEVSRSFDESKHQSRNPKVVNECLISSLFELSTTFSRPFRQPAFSALSSASCYRIRFLFCGN